MWMQENRVAVVFSLRLGKFVLILHHIRLISMKTVFLTPKSWKNWRQMSLKTRTQRNLEEFEVLHLDFTLLENDDEEEEN